MWRICSQLATTGHYCKAACAVAAALAVLQGLLEDGRSSSPHQIYTAALRPHLAADVTAQLRQSGLLEHLPTLLTDASGQLHAVAGVWPAAIEPADRARFEPMLHLWPEPALLAEQRAVHTMNLLMSVDGVLPISRGGTVHSAGCLMAGEHLVVASWQYLSGYLHYLEGNGNFSSSRRDSIQLTGLQQSMARDATSLALMSHQQYQRLLLIRIPALAPAPPAHQQSPTGPQR